MNKPFSIVEFQKNILKNQITYLYQVFCCHTIQLLMKSITLKSIKDTHFVIGTLFMFLLTLFSLQTIILGAIFLYLSYKLLMKMAKQQLKKLTKYFPQHMQQQLAHRNMFEVLNQFWFMQWIALVKIFLISFMYQMQPDHVIELISQSQPEFRQKLLGKRQQSIITQSNEKELKMVQEKQQENQKHLEFKQEESNEMQNHKISQKMLSQSSSTQQTVYKKPKTPSFILQKKFEDEVSSNEHNDNINLSQEQRDKLPVTLARKSSTKQGGRDFFKQLQKKITITKNLIGFTKSAFQLSVVSYKVRRAPKGTLVKIAILFWLALLIQIKINPRARKLLFKAMLIVSGVITILGATTATGVLIYRLLNSAPKKNQRNQIEESK